MSNFRPAGLSDDSYSDDDFYDRPKRQYYPPPQNAKKKIENSLQDAIINKNIGEVENIVDADLAGDVNQNLDSGWTPLMHGCFHAQENVVKMLLDKGADPNMGSATPICRDYVWGICSTVNCLYRHELDFGTMLKILKFCHDYQNKTCMRPTCTYLHITRAEETLFRQHGQIPSVLAERYVTSLTPEDRHKLMGPLPRTLSSQPAPAPHSSTMPSPASMGPPTVLHRRKTKPPTQIETPTLNMMPTPMPNNQEQQWYSQMPVAVPAQPFILAPPPPPPPPASPPTPATAAPTQMTTPVHIAAQTLQQFEAPYTQPREPTSEVNIPALFDPSRPPPSIPVKRSATSEPSEPGPTPAKMKVSIEQEKKILVEEENYRRKVYNRMAQEYQKGSMLRSMLKPQMFQVADEFFQSSINVSSCYATTCAAESVLKRFAFRVLDAMLEKVEHKRESGVEQKQE